MTIIKNIHVCTLPGLQRVLAFNSPAHQQIQHFQDTKCKQHSHHFRSSNKCLKNATYVLSSDNQTLEASNDNGETHHSETTSGNTATTCNDNETTSQSGNGGTDDNWLCVSIDNEAADDTWPDAIYDNTTFDDSWFDAIK